MLQINSQTAECLKMTSEYNGAAAEGICDMSTLP